jgi:hypothetical protein
VTLSGRRPHRRRAVAAGVFLPLSVTDPWGRGPTCLPRLALACALHRVHLAFSAADVKRIFENDFLEKRKIV